MRLSTTLLVLVLAAVTGLTVSGYLIRRAVTIEHADERRSTEEFARVREILGPVEPMLRMDEYGQVVRGTSPATAPTRPPSQLRVLAYRASEQRLVRAEVPFWFLQLKGPAVRFALRGTRVDLSKLGVTAADLERHGPGLVLDEVAGDGDRLLIWLE